MLPQIPQPGTKKRFGGFLMVLNPRTAGLKFPPAPPNGTAEDVPVPQVVDGFGLACNNAGQLRVPLFQRNEAALLGRKTAFRPFHLRLMGGTERLDGFRQIFQGMGSLRRDRFQTSGLSGFLLPVTMALVNLLAASSKRLREPFDLPLFFLDGPILFLKPFLFFLGLSKDLPILAALVKHPKPIHSLYASILA
jgi:hypothetical protein